MKAIENNLAKAEKPLPKGWRWRELGECAQLINGRAYGQHELLSQGTPVIRIQNLNGGKNWYYSNLDLPSEKYCDKGDLLFAWSTTFGPYIWIGEKSIFHYHIWKVLPNEILNKTFAFYLLQRITNDIKASSHGASMLHVTKGAVEKWEVPLPPLAEQKRIVAILSDRLSTIEKARAATIAQIEAAKALPFAYLRQFFDSSEAQKWNRKKLGDVCELLPAKSIATEGDTEVFAITTACLSETGFQPAGVKRARMTCTDAAISKVAPGEVLIARSNTADLVGRVAMYSGEVEGVVASDLTIRIKPHSILTSTFLNNYLSSLYIQGYWKEKAGGSSDSMKKITRSQLLDEFIPIPDLPEQHKITNAVSEKLSGVTALKRSLQDQLDAIDQLPAALLRQAFNGEL
ncbi:restriction endonuclease subunit S [Microcoleus sp. FACHB-1515]|uniref:restriction endonuclease subunit S n=1 Tax=Cyanophyceae TaxID=3028117 RepID=UPI00168399F1|nr:restriction endonuclease subunit S [Microcoleus sp. FACHB-1515]MBD2088316.1 restriction endonuclease subunit S [Microcoleus sp. FACHB-1515]